MFRSCEPSPKPPEQRNIVRAAVSSKSGLALCLCSVLQWYYGFNGPFYATRQPSWLASLSR